MKKTLVALAALAATGAFAQSTVTLSGVADVGFVYTSTNTNAPGAEKWRLDRGNNNRLVFSGVEDLGGGMAATFAFQLRFEPTRGDRESGTSAASIGYAAGGTTATPATGTTARPLFQGESTVGLRGGFGSVKLGRWLTAVQLPNGGMFDPWGVTTVAGNLYANGFASDYVRGGEGRVGNAIFYTTPSFSGFGANISYGFDKGPTSKNHTAVGLTYNNGPVQALLGWEKNRFGDAHTTLGGNYDFGSFKLFGNYYTTKGGSVADRAGTTFLATATGGGQVATDTTMKGWTLGSNIPMGAATIRVGYNRYTPGTPAAQNESKFGLGVNYALSKRTSIYSDIANQTRKNAALSSQNLFDLGIAHSF